MTDITTFILDSVKECRSGKTKRFELPKGVHKIDGRRLPEKLSYATNNDCRAERILFDLEGVTDLVIDGNGAELMFNGLVTPFYLKDAKRVTIKNLKIDWERPFMSQGVITAAHDDIIDLTIDSAKYPHSIQNDRLRFHGPDYVAPDLLRMLSFDAEKAETGYKTRDLFYVPKPYKAEDLGDGAVRLSNMRTDIVEAGQILVIKHNKRTSPGFVVSDCEDVRLEDIDIYQCGGMAVIAQNTHNIELHRTNVRRRPGTDRVFSANADATHFVDCSGRVYMIDCLFENQLDDPTNIHGHYRRVVDELKPGRFLTRLMHHQQVGVNTIRTGDPIGFYDDRSLECLLETQAAESSTLNCEFSELVAENAPSNIDLKHLVVMKQNRDVDVQVRGCTSRNNRARGFLISTLGKVVIEDNYFHTPGAAIKISGDANSWYESGPVEDVTIRNNTFDNCNFGCWGRALFHLDPEIQPENRSIPYHRGIRIVDNQIIRFQKPLIYARCVEGLEFTGNEIVESNAYPAAETDKPSYTLDGAVENSTLQELGE